MPATNVVACDLLHLPWCFPAMGQGVKGTGIRNLNCLKVVRSGRTCISTVVGYSCTNAQFTFYNCHGIKGLVSFLMLLLLVHCTYKRSPRDIFNFFSTREVNTTHTMALGNDRVDRVKSQL